MTFVTRIREKRSALTAASVLRWAKYVVPLLIVVVLLAVLIPSLGGPAPAADGAAGGVRVSLAEVFFIQRHPATKRIEWLGSLVIWLLLALSATSLALIGGLAWSTRREAMIPAGLIARSRTLLEGGHVHDLRDFIRPDPSYFAQVMNAAVEESPHGLAAMRRAAEQAADEHAVHRLRRIEPLNIIGNVAPMIGLFGTVYGMILAFREIVAAGGTPDPVSLAAGIGTALVTTFWGLIVAIPALAAYAVLRNRLDELTSHARREVEEALNTLRDSAPESGVVRAQKRPA